MSPDGPLDQVLRLVAVLDELDIPYALGGSFASSFFGEPRATMDVDVAVSIGHDVGEALLRRVDSEFIVPTESARRAIRTHDSFNLVPRAGGMKVDLFVLGDGGLDRRQIERRLLFKLPGIADGLWVTSPEDQVLRKLSGFRDGGSVSDRQWRDVIGILRVCGEDLDLADMRTAAAQIGLTELLTQALDEVAGSD